MNVRQFTDTAGRTWRLSFGYATARRVRDATGGRVDFLAAGRGSAGVNVFQPLAADVELLVQVLWLLVETQATAANVTETDFGESLNLQTLEAATTALLEATIDFFPSRSQRLMTSGAALAQKIVAEEAGKAEQRAAEMMQSPEMEQLIRAAVRGNSLSSIAAFSESVPVNCGETNQN